MLYLSRAARLYSMQSAYPVLLPLCTLLGHLFVQFRNLHNQWLNDNDVTMVFDGFFQASTSKCIPCFSSLVTVLKAYPNWSHTSQSTQTNSIQNGNWTSGVWVAALLHHIADIWLWLKNSRIIIAWIMNFKTQPHVEYNNFEHKFIFFRCLLQLPTGVVTLALIDTSCAPFASLSALWRSWAQLSRNLVGSMPALYVSLGGSMELLIIYLCIRACKYFSAKLMDMTWQYPTPVDMAKIP